ncbi:MAG: LysM domain-containing protein [Bdellovibrionota bacterium]
MKLFISKSFILASLLIAPGVFAQAADEQAEAKKSANESAGSGFGNPVPLENSAPMENSNSADNASRNTSPRTEPAAAPDPKANVMPAQEMAVPAAARSSASESNAAAVNAAAVNEAASNGVMPAHEIKNEKSSSDTMTEKPVEIDQKDFMRPAWDMTGAQSIDIQSRMKKISEPNLFAGAAPNPGTLRNLASGEAPEEYTVLEGDTLFDICDQLIDEADYWPKLWAFNPTIENPHFVYPGMRLRFYAGDDKSPPFLQVITEDDILPVAKGQISEAELVREDINGMLMRSEIPENTTILEPSDLDAILRVDSMFVMVGNGYRNKSKDVIIPAFITSEEITAIGTVVGGSAGSFLVDKGQQIIMEDEEGLVVGTTYSVLRKTNKIKNSKNDNVGLRYEFVAQLKVTSEDSEKDGVFKGDIVFNRLGVEPGDLIVAYRSVKRTVPNVTVPDSRGVEQEVVNFTEPGTELGGRGGFVFFDQTDGKLEENKTYKIVQNVRVSAGKFLKDELPDTDSKVAHVYIIDNKGSAALGYLVQDSLEVRIGDRVAR